MVIHKDTNVYMTKNVTCTTRVGIFVDYDNGSDGPAPIPHVTFDMRGHTLTGTRTAAQPYTIGIDNPDIEVSGQSYVTVRNGALTGWYVGIGAGQNGSVDHVRLVANSIGMSCEYVCKLTDSVVERNTLVGLSAGVQPTTVSRVVFYGNAKAAEAGGLSNLSIDHSFFTSNKVGIYAIQSRAVVSDSLFTGNDIVAQNGEDSCITLTRDPLIGNRVTYQGANIC